MSRKRPDWSRPLPRPLVIPKIMMLRTLADVRKLLGHLPTEASQPIDVAARETHLKAAASDAADVVIVLQMVLMMEQVECRPTR